MPFDQEQPGGFDMRTPIPAAATAALLLSLSASQALPQKTLQFGAAADLVLIDLIATDDDGRRVVNLRPEEIEIYEDGKRQSLEMLRFVGDAVLDSSLSPPAVPVAAPEPRAAAPSSVAASSPTSASRLVVVIDHGAMPSELFVPVRAAILKMVRETLDPETQLMLVTLDRGLQVRIPFTSDTGRFIAALEAIKPAAPGAELAMSDLMDQVERMCDPDIRNSDKNAIGVARAFIEDVRRGVTNATDAARVDRGFGDRGSLLRRGRPGLRSIEHAGRTERGAHRVARGSAGGHQWDAPLHGRRGQSVAGFGIHR
jgi:VWFA-related protein